jgi:hypothetical protein
MMERKSGHAFFASAEKFVKVFASEGEAPSILTRLKRKCIQHLECLHVWKGFLLDFENLLLGTTPLNKKEKAKKVAQISAFVNKNRAFFAIFPLFNHQSLKQCNGYEHRQILFGAKEFFYPNFSEN